MKKVLYWFVAVMMLFTLTITAFASNETNDGNIKITVQTDKESYGATGVAEITATISNVSGEDISNVTAQAVFDDLAPAGKRKSETSKSVDVLKAGESFSFTYKATLNKDEHKLNFFQKIILWFVRLFNGGYSATIYDIEADIENITEIKFGKYTVRNIIEVNYDKKTITDEQFESADETICNLNNIAKPYTDENGYIDIDKREEILQLISVELEKYKKEEIVEEYYIGEDSATIIFDGNITYIYTPEVELELSGSGESNIVTIESFDAWDIILSGNEQLSAEIDAWVNGFGYGIGLKDNVDFILKENNNYVYEEEIKKSQFTIEKLKNLPNYKILIMEGHGAWNSKNNYCCICTGESVTKKNRENYAEAISNNELVITSGTLQKSTYAVTPVFLSKYLKENENSLVFLENCYSLKNEVLAKMFMDKGAFCVIGYDDAADISYGKLTRSYFFRYATQRDDNGRYPTIYSIINKIKNEFSEYLKNSKSTGEIKALFNEELSGSSKTLFGEINNSSSGGDSGNIDTKSASVNGSVVDANTQSGILGVKAMLYSEDTNQTYTVYTDENGNFSIKNLSAGRYTLSFEHELYVTNHEMSFTLSDGLMFVITKPFKFSKRDDVGNNTTTVTGVVKDEATNNVISGVTVNIADSDGNVTMTTTTDENGKFSINLPVGDHQIVFLCDGYIVFGQLEKIEDVSENIDLGEIYLKRTDTPGGEDDITIIASGNCGVNGDSVKWTLYDDGELVISGSGAMADYSNSSRAPWNSYGSSIIKVTIKNGVTNIGDYAFDWCQKLTNITIPDSVTSIGRYAFNFCQKLTNITIPDSVTSIGGCAFYSCSGLASIIIPNSVTSIDDETFYHCNNLASITIPETITHIGWRVFEDTMYYKNDSNWENGVLYIGCHLIAAKPSIMGNYEIKPGTKTIAERAFYRCEKLEGVTIPNGIKKIESSVFYGCTKLITVVLPDSLVSIGQHAFQYCASIESIIIPDSVIFIDFDAFANCENIKNITIPASAEVWSASAFNGCKSIKNIVITKGNGIMVSPCNVWHASENKDLNVTLEEGITNIRASAFSGCTSLKSIVIPESVIKIEVNAFLNCVNLTKLTIPASTEIQSSAFFGCTAITDILISKGTGTMISYTKETYELTPWYRARNNELNITLENGISNIGSYAFHFCNGISNIVIPNSVTQIEEYAFGSCYGLTSVDLPNSVTSIGDNAFAWCQKLSNITIPDSVTNIGSRAFSSSGLTSLRIGNGIKNIGDSAFLATDITDVYYSGTEEEWKSITFGTNSEYLTNAAIHYNS